MNDVARIDVGHAKGTLVQILRRQLDPEDLAAFVGQATGKFESLIHLVEDRDPHWLAYALRDPQFDRGVRLEIAGYLRGSDANALVLELLG